MCPLQTRGLSSHSHSAHTPTCLRSDLILRSQSQDHDTDAIPRRGPSHPTPGSSLSHQDTPDSPFLSHHPMARTEGQGGVCGPGQVTLLGIPLGPGIEQVLRVRVAETAPSSSYSLETSSSPAEVAAPWGASGARLWATPCLTSFGSSWFPKGRGPPNFHFSGVTWPHAGSLEPVLGPGVGEPCEPLHAVPLPSGG